MRLTILLIYAFVLFSAVVAQADTINIPTDYPTIQQGIGAAVNGDTVLVAPGTYVENIDFHGKAIIVKSSDGAETTCIDGNLAGTVVIFDQGEASDSVLEGFTVTNGKAGYGGGIYCYLSSPLITTNVITGNMSQYSGGGILSRMSSPTITDNTITGNSADFGGGIECWHESYSTISNNIIAGNTADMYGGGISCAASSPVITNNRITGNHTSGTPDYGGGGICCHDSSPSLTSNYIKGNSADYDGGGIYCNDSSSPTLTGNIIDENLAGDDGGGIFCNDLSSPMLTGNRIAGNTANDNGGGIFCYFDSSPSLTFNTIRNNTANHGGGIYCENNCYLNLISNTISNNSAAQNGGGVLLLHQSGLVIENNNLVMGNSAGWNGGGIYSEGLSVSSLTNNIIAGNSADNAGGGIFCYLGSSIQTKNSTVIGNTASIDGGGILCEWHSGVTLVNSILWENSAPTGPEASIRSAAYPSGIAVSYSDVKGGSSSILVETGCILTWGDGMIDAEPLFVDPDNNDYHLTFDSPCRDTGDNSEVNALDDFEGDPRIAWDGTVDMGADEFYTHLYVTGNPTPCSDVHGKLVGMPGTTPVGLIVGSGVRPAPASTPYGDFWLFTPVLLIPLATIPADGVLTIPATIPRTPPAPYNVPMQGLVGLSSDSLTNLCVLEVR